MLTHREHDLTFRFSRLRTFFSTMASAWVTMLFSGPPPISSALLGASMGFAEAQSTGIVTASVSRPAAHYSFGKLTKHTQTYLGAGSAMRNHMKETLKCFLPQNFKSQSNEGRIVHTQEPNDAAGKLAATPRAVCSIVRSWPRQPGV